jgi:DNA-directed RNA polymerase beta' subunit
MNEEQKEELRKYLEKEVVKEDYCPHCGEESRLIKVFDCTDRYYRCLSCLGLVWIGAIPIKGKPQSQGSAVIRWYEKNPSPEDLRAYADAVEKENKEKEKKNERRGTGI